MCASFHSQARRAESTWHKFGHQAQYFIHKIGWVNFLAFITMIAISRPKSSCSHAKINHTSSPSKVMKDLAQTDFCSYLPDASSSTKITMVNTIHSKRVQVRCLQIFVTARQSCWACGCTKVWCHNNTIKALDDEEITQKLYASTRADKKKLIGAKRSCWVAQRSWHQRLLSTQTPTFNSFQQVPFFIF